MHWRTSDDLPVSVEQQVDAAVVATRVFDDDTSSDTPQSLVAIHVGTDWDSQPSHRPSYHGSLPGSPGQITLTIDENDSALQLGLTALEQYELMLIARKLRRYTLLEMFVAIIIIPLFEFPWWFFVYLLAPVTGFVAARHYAKHPLRVYLISSVSTTACWCLVPFLHMKTEASNAGTLMFWIIFFLLKVCVTYFSLRLYLVIRTVSNSDCKVLADMHLGGAINIR